MELSFSYFKVFTLLTILYPNLVSCLTTTKNSDNRVTPNPTPESGDNPLWKTIVPVMAFICIMIIVFLVFVCFAQNFERRLRPCRSLCARLQRLCHTGNRDIPDSRELEDGTITHQPQQTVSPHTPATEILSVEDRQALPPSYDESHKYHRRDSFSSPPVYDTAVASLRKEKDSVSPQAGETDIAPSNVTVQVDQ